MNIALIGFKGAGKTTVCKLLAKRLDKKYISTEEEIAKKAKLSLASLLRKQGLETFYELECEAVERVSDFDECVVDTSHSVVIRNENITNLKRNSLVILLTADVKTMMSRLKSAKEQLKSSDAWLQNDFQKYEPLYRKAADYAIDTSRMSPEEICDLIAHYVQMELQ